MLYRSLGKNWEFVKKKRGFFIAATGQNVGKTTTCLGLVSGLLKRKYAVDFIKPVGQEQIKTQEGFRVDKDALLFKNHFDLQAPVEKMSPVLFPKGFTRDYLDEKVSRQELLAKIINSYESLKGDTVIIEGTGHVGVGSIVDLNNAQVAKILGVSMILIAPGGLGSSFDELALNLLMCRQYGVSCAGVILNRVLDEKRSMIIEYMSKALTRWEIPLLGCIPYNAFLSSPTMQDFEQLFQTKLISGFDHRLRHFKRIRLVANSVEIYKKAISSNQLIITPAEREDIVCATIAKYWDVKIADQSQELEMGIILTGKEPPKKEIVDQLRKANIPALHIPVGSFVAMKMMTHHISKIRTEDRAKVQEAIALVEEQIDFEALLTNNPTNSKNDVKSHLP